MEKTRQIKIISLCALLVAVLGLTVAFAALSQTLTINGSAAVNTASWDIHFENLTLSEKTGTAEVSGTPQLTGTAISGIDVSLNKPGDKIVYEFDLVNNGSIEAKLTNINVNNLISKSSYIQKYMIALEISPPSALISMILIKMVDSRHKMFLLFMVRLILIFMMEVLGYKHIEKITEGKVVCG